MTARRGLFFIKDGPAPADLGTTPQDARLALAGLLTPAGDLGVVPGVLSGCLVTGSSGWTYSVSAGHVVGTRGAQDGAALYSVDGQTPTPSVSPAPASGSRWDLIWVRQRDRGTDDTDSAAVLGVTSGTASGAPSKPYGDVPAGAVVLAEAQVAAGATQTAHANVSITPVAVPVAARGGVVPASNEAARLALATLASPTARTPLLVMQMDTGVLWLHSGGAPVALVGGPRAWTAQAAGDFGSTTTIASSTYVGVAAVTISNAPAGQYRLDGTATMLNTVANQGRIRLRVGTSTVVRESRADLQTDVFRSFSINGLYTHGGGNLVVTTDVFAVGGSPSIQNAGSCTVTVTRL